MPGPIVHLIVQQRLPWRLGSIQGGLYFGGKLASDMCSPYSAFGSIGPDFLFFSRKQQGQQLDDFTKFLFDVYDRLEPLIKFQEQKIDPVAAKIDLILTQKIQGNEPQLKALLQDIKVTAQASIQSSLLVTEVVATGATDFFFPFYPRVQQGEPESKWYWSDFLHQRRTGQFASRLWHLAGSDADLQRYAIGYACHVAVDVVGHPFVNLVTGGPHRMHWHRHKLVENWIDAYARNRYQDDWTTKTCLNLGLDKYLPDAISGSYYYRLVEFDNGRLPDKLVRLIATAMRDVYDPIAHPAYPSGRDVGSAYELWLAWFKRATTIGMALPPAPIAPPSGPASALMTGYVSGLPAQPSSSTPSSSTGFQGIIKKVWDWCKWMSDVVAYTATWVVNHVGDIWLLPVTAGLELTHWLIYQISKGIWEIYDNLRFMLVLGAYFFPEQRDLAKSPWGKCFVNSAHAYLSHPSGPQPDFNKYPLKPKPCKHVGLTEHHLRYPDTAMEGPHAEPAPHPYEGKFPEIFIDGAMHNAAADALYNCLEPYGLPAPRTHPVDASTWTTGQLGNALDFSAKLIAQSINNIPNFNLDADRGYGWKTWQADDPGNINTDNPVPVHYIDP